MRLGNAGEFADRAKRIARSAKEKFGAYMKKYTLRDGDEAKSTSGKVKERKLRGEDIASGERDADAAIKPIAQSMSPAATKILWGIICAAAGFLLGGAEVYGGLRPFGAAFLCASRANVFWIYGGLVLSSVVFGPDVYAYVYIVVYTAAVLLRYLSAKLLSCEDRPVKAFAEPMSIRVLSACTSLFIIGMYSLFAGKFEIRTVVATAVGCGAAGVFAALFGSATDGSARLGFWHDAGVCALACVLVYSIRDFYIVGFSAAVIASGFLTLLVARDLGIAAGGVAGILLGLASAPKYAPALAVMGLGSGLVFGIGGLAAVASSVVLCVITGVFTAGFSAVGSLAPDVLISAAVFTPLAQFGVLPKLRAPASAAKCEAAEEKSSVSVCRESDYNGRLRALSCAMTELSEMFHTLSERVKNPDRSDIRMLCEKTYRKYCDTCRLSSVCFGEEQGSTLDAMMKLSDCIAHHGTAESSALPDYFVNRCPNTDKIVAELNLEHARMLERSAGTDKMGIFAIDYEAMAKLLKDASEENSKCFERDEELTAKIRAGAGYIGLPARSMAVYGGRRKSIIVGGVELMRTELSADEIRASFEKICGMALTTPVFRVDGDFVTMSMTSARVIGARSAVASVSKLGEQINGDTSTAFFGGEDFFYSLISDGMGSGKDAALASRTTAIFLTKMLASGNRKSTVLGMLNNFIRNKNIECFATVDLLELDLLSSRASFIKSGAAPSYILRRGKLFRISSNSLPIGITREITAEEIKFDLEVGDVIAMISDGVAQSFDDGVWLADLLTYGWDKERSLDGMAELILGRAKERNSRSDDMTVRLVTIEDARPDAGSSKVDSRSAS